MFEVQISYIISIIISINLTALDYTVNKLLSALMRCGSFRCAMVRILETIIRLEI